mgnify:CR=1 FL=1
MPYNNRTTLKYWLSEADIDQAYTVTEDDSELEASLNQSASIIEHITGQTAPDTVPEAEKTLQFCDAWVWAYYSLTRFSQVEEDTARIINERYKEAMRLLNGYTNQKNANDSESTLKPQSQIGGYNSLDGYNSNINNGLRQSDGGGFFTEW